MTRVIDPCVVVVTALGVDIAIRCEGAAIAEHVRTAWADAVETQERPVHSEVTVGLSPQCDVTGRDIDELLHRLSPRITTCAIAARAGDLVMLHAAALADPRTGAAAVLIAASGTGKTTAASTLGRHFVYVTDETAGIGSDGVLVPHRKPLSIIRSGRLKDQVAASSLGLLTNDRSSHLGAMLIIERDPHHSGQPDVSLLDTIDALALIAPQASALSRLDRPLHRLVHLIDRVHGVRHVRYAESASLKPVIENLLVEASA